ncbi:envelope glycoprotein N [Proboscivirus elephantidbeta4]|uniref:Envelope glycoprotein N n=1 Tax=Elephant endotheliotropic herpesvirus 4 TaxID=548914 RepID=A0A0S1TQX3_9BETA|nr:envelope glycoprotein N [Elephant endotheliotropic herpesvirus 4]ALM25996.1 envelope glycoprotein N [Elephant endotheliotropic herpesvirus 4]
MLLKKNQFFINIISYTLYVLLTWTTDMVAYGTAAEVKATTPPPNIKEFGDAECSATEYRIYASSFLSILNIVVYVLLFFASIVYVRYLCHKSITTDAIKSY